MTDQTQWQRWFSWHPVETVDQRFAWMRMIERRWNWDLNGWAYGGYSGTDGGWEYRLEVA